jgi:Phospholipase B
MQYSRNSSLGAICGRGDVDGAHPVAYGCYDTKVANFAMAAQRWAAGVVGPTTGQVRCSLPNISWPVRRLTDPVRSSVGLLLPDELNGMSMAAVANMTRP